MISKRKLLASIVEALIIIAWFFFEFDLIILLIFIDALERPVEALAILILISITTDSFLHANNDKMLEKFKEFLFTTE